MVPTIRAVYNGTLSLTNVATVTIDSVPQAGDLLLVVATNGGSSPTLPSGNPTNDGAALTYATAATHTITTNRPTLKVWSTVLDAAGTRTFTGTWAAGTPNIAGTRMFVIALSGYDATTPVAAGTAFVTGASGAQLTVTAVTAALDALDLVFFVFENSGAAGPTFTPPSGWTERADVTGSGANSYGIGVELISRTVTAAGSQPTVTSAFVGSGSIGAGFRFTVNPGAVSTGQQFMPFFR